MADTKRITSSQVSVSVDTARNTIKTVSVTVDAKRVISKPVTVTADACRVCDNISVSVTVAVDTKRTKAGAVTVAVDTNRKRKGDLSDIISLAIGLQNQTLADSYQIDTLNDAALGKIYAGTLFGWTWECTLQSKQFDPATKRWAMHGDYDIAETLKKYIEFYPSARRASSILTALAGQLGKTLVNLTDDHGVRRMSEQSTVMQVLSSLYGWTTAAPNILTNVFLRGGTLYAVQRGKEPSSYAPVKYNVISVSQQKIDTLMNTGKWSPQIIGDPTGEYTAGTLSFSNASVEYVNGYVVRTVDGSGTVRTYAWGADESDDPDVQKYMIESTELPAGEQVPYITDYNYGIWRSQKYLASEVTRQYKTYEYTELAPFLSNLPGTKRYFTALAYQKIVNYMPVGNNFFASWGSENKWKYGSIPGSIGGVFGLISSEENKMVSQVSEGRPGGGPVTPREQSSEDTTPKIYVPYTPLASSHIPVTDYATLTRYYNALAALDGKTEHKMTIDCYDEHVIDYTETVVIDGVTWYLDGNSILLSGDKPYKKQTVQLVRWA